MTRIQSSNGGIFTPGENTVPMYEHGLATIALCEAYGMTEDSAIRDKAQAAINYIQSGQNDKGGWRYVHGGSDSDTSVAGWQVMALKSGQIAGLQVDQAILDKAKQGMIDHSAGAFKGKFRYIRAKAPDPPMTAVGLLCMQYMGTPANDPGLAEGKDYLMANMPRLGGKRDIYYWYYATQVLHNMPGADWEKWNRNMRKILVETQTRGNVCAEGSWNPEEDEWGGPGGRIMVTALSCLTLEVYYRYLPLYKINEADDLAKPEAGLGSVDRTGNGSMGNDPVLPPRLSDMKIYSAKSARVANTPKGVLAPAASGAALSVATP